MSNFQDFTRQLREEQGEFREAIDQATRKLALQGLTGVVRKSPVDTGRFRANWMVDIGQEQERTRESTDQTAALSEGESVISRAEVFKPIVLHNNLPYGPPLEDGWSDQAPQGMVAVTAAELESQFGDIE